MKFSWQVPQFKQLSLSSAIIFLIVEIQDQTWLFDADIKGEKLQAMNNFLVLPDIWMISIYLICSCSKVIDKLFFTFSWLQFSYHKVSSFYQLSSTNSSSIMSRWPSIECKVFPILFETLVLGWTIRFLVSTDGGKTSQERTERSWSRICWYERKIMCGHRTDNGWTIYFDLYHLCASTSW